MSGPKRTIKPIARKKQFTPEILDLFRQAHGMWLPAHAHVVGDAPEDEEANRAWNAISTQLRRLLGLGPWCTRVESPYLDCDEPLWNDQHPGTRDWKRCQRIRRRLLEATGLQPQPWAGWEEKLTTILPRLPAEATAECRDQ